MAEFHQEIDSVLAQEEFIKLRNRMEKIARDTPYPQVDYVYGEAFGEIYTNATLGDTVAQDYLGYIFKRGKEGLVPENIDLSMKWLILAGANGNQLSIERLAIFLNYAYDEIIYQPDIGKIKYKNNFDEFNYTYVLGRVICEALVDELEISALSIIKKIPDTLEHNPITMGIYDRARNKVIPVVLDYLRGKVPQTLKEKEIEKRLLEQDEKEKQAKQEKQNQKSEKQSSKKQNQLKSDNEQKQESKEKQSVTSRIKRILPKK